MRHFTSVVFSLVMFAGIAFAQDGRERAGIGYLFIAPGGVVGSGETAGTVHIGGGYEQMIYKGFGAGVELGGIAGKDGVGVGVFSTNASYHFPSPKGNPKLVPFVTSGYTRAGGCCWAENWFNVGGGIDYWFRERRGLRLEFRDNVDPNHSEPLHFLGARIGFIW